MTRSISRILLAFLLVGFGNLGCHLMSVPSPSHVDAREFCESYTGMETNLCREIEDREELTPEEAQITVTVMIDKSIPMYYSYTNMAHYYGVHKIYATRNTDDNVALQKVVSENYWLQNISFEPMYFVAYTGKDYSPGRGEIGEFLSEHEGNYVSPGVHLMPMSHPRARGYHMIAVLLFEMRGIKYYLDLPNFIVE